MENYADLEIGLHRRDVNYYAVDLRFFDQQADADVRLISGSDLPLVRFDLEHLRSLSLDNHAYGAALTAALFANPNVVAAFDKAYTIAQSQGTPLRVRLFIGPSAPDLHGLRWETLHFPNRSDTLLTSEHILYSRYLSSSEWQPVRLRPRGDLRTLVIVANPANLHEFTPNDSPLAPVDVDDEIARAYASMGNSVTMTVLASHSTAVETLHTTSSATTMSLRNGGLPTLNNLISHMRDDYDIIYLVAHGALDKGDPMLWLEDAQGNADVTPGREFVRRIRDLRQRPRLVVLASCQSAGSGDDRQSQDGGTLTALGPQLIEIGIPAVLAMQDNVTMQTIATFLPTFFQELLSKEQATGHDGQIDHAMAVARGAVHQQRPDDWWVPVLMMRLKSGYIWYQPGFADDSRNFQRWPAIMKNIQKQNCTPILGSHLSELFGSQVEIARRWAEKYKFPLEPHRSEHLSQAAQYLAVKLDPNFPCDDLLDQMQQELLIRYSDALSADERRGTLEDMFAAVGRIRRQDESDPYRVLAELPFPVYITTNFTNLLEEALRATGKQPVTELCRWNEDTEQLTSMYDDEPNYQPTVELPLVYHLFGMISEPDSLVITEDNYFDYLIGLTKNKELIPPPVGDLLKKNGLLFLGLQPDDWDFRILLRSLETLWDARKRRKHISISVQITPDKNHRIQDPGLTRRYLEDYFQKADIDIYWGTVADFTRDLLEQMRK